MTTIQISLKQPTEKYPILIGQGLLKNAGKIIAPGFASHQIVIITDRMVEKLYGLELRKTLQEADFKVEILSFPPGEKHKNQTTVTALQHAMLKKKYGRDTLILALGGGVVGDVAGYVAATYLRGIPYIQVPTTLLAMVDSSVGGKVGIDTPYGKNTLGAFYQPVRVIVDTALVCQLPTAQFLNGLFEVIKGFFISDVDGLKLCKKLNLKNPGSTLEIVEKIITLSVQFKAKIIKEDEKESNKRRILNFGHTLGHALEKLSHYTLPHGYAVGYGMIAEAKIAQVLGILPAQDFAFLQTYLEYFGLKPGLLQKYSSQEIIKATLMDKKVRGNKPYYVLLEKIGQVYTKEGQYAQPVEDKIAEKAFSLLPLG